MKLFLVIITLALLLLAVLVGFAVLGSRSKPPQTPTQATENPYRKFYS